MSKRTGRKIAISDRASRELAYERGRREIISEVKIDPVIDIKDKAEQMRLYAIRRNDPDLEVAASAIALRAHYRIGQISKELEKGVNQYARSTGGTGKAAILKAAGISKAAANRDEHITEIITEDEIDKLCRDAVETGKPAPSAVAIYKQDQDDKAKITFGKIKTDIPSNLHVGDFRETAKVIPNDSVDLVFTDPPYDRESIPLYEAAAAESKRILKSGGSMICYCGQLILPEVIPLMRKHLNYFWIGAHVHDGGPMSRMQQFAVIVGFKPLLWFIKGERRADRQTFVNDTVLVKREKDFHSWQQAIATAENFIGGLSDEGGTVVDFFAGGGTTLIAAKNLKRLWQGFEIDQKAIVKIMERIK